MLKALLLSTLVSLPAIAGAPAGAPKHPMPFWFFEATYADGRINTYPVQMDEFTMALPYNGRVLTAELPSIIPAKNAIGKSIKRRFTAARGDDVLAGEVVCDLSKYQELNTVAGEFILKFSGGTKSSTPTQLRFFCQF
jgi:hypothetical protein